MILQVESGGSSLYANVGPQQVTPDIWVSSFLGASLRKEEELSYFLSCCGKQKKIKQTLQLMLKPLSEEKFWARSSDLCSLKNM